MAHIRVRYLVRRPGAQGGLPRWFWQPSPALRREGWRTQRVPLDWQRHTDAGALQAAAIRRAEELNAEMDAAREARALPVPAVVAGPDTRTLGALILAYRGSRRFQQRAPATRRGYEQALRKLEAWGGDAPVRAIDGRRIQRLHESLSATPAFANATVRVLRLLLHWGWREDWLTQVPPTPVLSAPPPSGVIWPREAVLRFVQAADAMERPSIGTAVLLNEWLGQREGDLLRMPRTALRGAGADRRLVVRQSKTGAGVTLPIGLVPALADRLAEQLARDTGAATPTTILVCEGTGRPWQKDHFRHEFAAVRAYAADVWPSFEVDHLRPGRDMTAADAFQVPMQDLTFMKLRHTAVTRLAEAGCEAPLIASVTGHSLETVAALLKRYLVRTGEQARVAFARRLASEGGQ